MYGNPETPGPTWRFGDSGGASDNYHPDVVAVNRQNLPMPLEGLARRRESIQVQPERTNATSS